MNDILPFIPTALNDVQASLAYFKPELSLGILFILVMVAGMLSGRNPGAHCRNIAIMGLVFVLFQTLLQLPLVQTDSIRFFNGMLLLHRPGVVFKLAIDVLAILILLYIPWDKALRAHFKGLTDLYAIIMASVLGLHLMVMAVNLLSIYISVEMVSIASYLMVAYRSDAGLSTEAGMKYVLFGAVCSAIMLYGISLLYGFAGTTDILDGNFILSLNAANPAMAGLAVTLLLVGIGFKLSFVPMHFWVPDVYQGAATPVTAYLSTLPKIAAFGLLTNVLTPFIFGHKFSGFDFRIILSAISIVTMLAGNLGALYQTNIKRMLAYSSIGHTGFALMAMVTFSQQGISALIFYLLVYAIANLGALMAASYFVNKIGADDLDSYNGAGLRFHLPAVCFVIILISLAGLPITAGFNGKLLVFSAVYQAYQQNHDVWLLALMVTGSITTVISLFYYIKIPLHLFLKKNEKHVETLFVSHRYLLVLICFVAFALLALFWAPQMLSDLIE